MVEVERILEQVKNGQLSVAEAKERLTQVGDLGYAQLDLNRQERTGFPEVVYAAGKTVEQVIGIFEKLKQTQDVVLATRVTSEQGEQLQNRVPGVIYDTQARVAVWSRSPLEPQRNGYVCVVAAGTSDLPVAEEAAWTLRCFGSEVRVIADVGVAGIHRLFHRLEEIRGASVIVCVAGMEGALTSVVAGLVDKPVIAVPTSVGYGSSFGGLSALLTMLNSCASGVAVVNIDNGFGAGYLAGMIHRQAGLDH
ncbi:nickel pincer cofactor biosynthesis protein LarB [Brevibacillus humidisoli]|uniref:nickel pincer cofactor biosynthesis protein LarB n=1 Tax=Brevibacillus humidisoli TaxID=2895522 RepID=UPI001E3F54F4|nr:nickel pincer cofactor biosynthesis protein LarB [Brevibacillus humidisoli]UFJ39178.1 nickel pincer cofactor biosynthesis protein LarB [Brevibacillus humidisoli]